MIDLEMKLEAIAVDTDKFTYGGVDFDIDRYTVTLRSPMASHEYTLSVDHANLEISGDVIRYGSWDDMDHDEVAEIMELLHKEGKLKRPTNSLFKIK